LDEIAGLYFKNSRTKVLLLQPGQPELAREVSRMVLRKKKKKKALSLRKNFLYIL
jgi:hypothetical protein